jgi:two-component system sensor histidine kinase PhcS
MKRIRDVVTDLKTFAYPEKVGVESDVAVAELVRHAMKIVAGEMDGVRIEVDLPEDFEVRGQKTQLMHIFINLLNNASRAMRESGRPDERIVWITGECVGDLAVVRVRDSGPGIPADIVTRVFDPFFTTRDVGSGMGMGLSICHTILNSHRGSIRVENHPEGGALFTIELPLAEAALIPC